MFGLFKKEPHEVEEPKQVLEEKKYPAVVYEIHNEFHSAGDKLLAESLNILKECRSKDINKGKKLFSLGFKNTPQAKEATEVENKEKLAKETAELVEYFSIHYPNNKFITEDMVKQICEKYSLVCGEVGWYKGFVPERNMNQIEQFKVREEDDVKYRFVISSDHAEVPFSSCDESFLNELQVSYLVTHGLMYISNNTGIVNTYIDGNPLKPEYANMFSNVPFAKISKEDTSGMYICAPVKDMEIPKSHEISGYKIIKHIPDPVVLKPVKGGYLIVTAWGDESSDPIVVNEKMN